MAYSTGSTRLMGLADEKKVCAETENTAQSNELRKEYHFQTGWHRNKMMF